MGENAHWNKLNFSPSSSGENAVISQLRSELSEARQQLKQMRTQLLAAEEDAQLHAQDVSLHHNIDDAFFA